MSKIAVVIPNWDGEKIISKCLESLKKQTLKNFKVVIVDNGSKDNSVEIIKKYKFVDLIELKKNTGFARGSNIGIRKALEDEKVKFICPMNNDMELDKNYLKNFIKTFEKLKKKNKKVGILAAKLLFKFEKNLINTVGTLIYRDGSGMERGYKEKDKGQYEKIEEIFGGCGAAVLYTRKMLKDIEYKNKEGKNSYFDEDFFAYYEDLDLNYRSRLMGYKAYYTHLSFAFHIHSATGVSFSEFKSFHVHRNQYYVLIKNFPFPFLMLSLFLFFFRYCLMIISVIIKKGPSSKLKKNVKKGGLVKIVFASWKEVVKNLPLLLKKRKLILKKRKITLLEFNSWFKKYKADLFKMVFKT